MTSKDVSCPVGERVVSIVIPRNVTDWIEVEISSQTTGKIIAMVIFYIIVVVTAGFGNALVIYVIGKKKGLQTRTNIYVANLASSDLLVTLTCMWVHLGSSVSPSWPFGQFFCKSFAFFQAWAVTSSVLFMTLIAGNRFFAIVFPLRAHASRNMAVGFIACVWGTSGLVSLPHLLYNDLHSVFWKNWVERFCEDSWPRYYYNSTAGCLTHKPGKTIYVTCCFVMLYLVPILLMTFAYTSVAWSLYTRQRTIEPNDSVRVHHQRTRFKVIRMLVAVLVAFTICWTPLQALLMWDVHRSKDTMIPDSIETAKYVCTFMAYSNSALNPVIYVTLSESFRNAFWQTLSKRNQVASADIQDVRTSNVNHKITRHLNSSSRNQNGTSSSSNPMPAVAS